MRILAIRGRNLASLAGPFEIDLTAEPIAGTGLFAITGETGAGKSTILDALALALYGEHPRAGGSERQPDPASKDGLGATDSRALLRRGTGSGFAEVDFVGIDGEAYRARWAVNRARGKAGGNLQAADRSLVRLADGAGKASGERLVTRAVEELTGLTFAQFRRTVLLAQGEFDAFLMASEANRAELLERITGTEIYRGISRRVHEMQAERQQAHRALVERREAIGLLTEDERSALRGGRQQALEMARLGQELANARSALTQASGRLAAAEAGLPEFNAALVSATAAIAECLPGVQAAEAEVVALEPLWEEALRRDEAVRLLGEDLAKREQEARDANSRLAGLDTLVAEAVSALDAIGGEMATLSAALDARPQDAGLASRAEDIDGLIQKRGDLGEDRGRKAREAAKQQELFDKAEAAVKELSAQSGLLEDEISGIAAARLNDEAARDAVNEPALMARRTVLDDQLAATREAWRLAGLHEGAKDKAERAGKALISALADGHAARTEAGEANAAIAAARTALEAVERLAELAESAASREAAALRSRLAAGEPCPVCGATDHPGTHDEGELQSLASVMRHERRQAQEALRAGQMRLAEAGRQEAIAEGAAAGARTSSDAANGEATTAAEELLALRPRLPDNAPTVPGAGVRAALEALGRHLLTEQAAIRSQADLLQACKDRIEASHQREREARDRLARLAAKREAALASRTEAELAAGKLAVELGGLDERLTSIERELGNAGALSALGRDMAAIDASPKAARDLLARLVRDFRNRTRRKADLEGAHRRQSDLLVGHRAERAAAAKAADRMVLALQEASIARQMSVAARAALLGGEATGTHRTRHLKLLETARKQLAGAKEAQATARATLEAAIKAHRTAGDEAAQARATADVAEGEFRAALAASGMDPAAVPGSLGEFIAERQQTAGSASERLQQDMRARADSARLAAEIALSEADLAVWNDVHAAIGSASGDIFRRFAQGFTLDHLVALANEHLAALSPRYRLERGTLSDLALVVVDRDMADERRAVRSLSGGERFLVSLGLALALSGLEGRQAFVDTLFIDEGFGALDAETLDMAVDALEALQGRGRKVGVVTHVAAMIERIAVKVLVEKRGGGRSEVRVVGGY